MGWAEDGFDVDGKEIVCGWCAFDARQRHNTTPAYVTRNQNANGTGKSPTSPTPSLQRVENCRKLHNNTTQGSDRGPLLTPNKTRFSRMQMGGRAASQSSTLHCKRRRGKRCDDSRPPLSTHPPTQPSTRTLETHRQATNATRWEAYRASLPALPPAPPRRRLHPRTRDFTQLPSTPLTKCTGVLEAAPEGFSVWQTGVRGAPHPHTPTGTHARTTEAW